MSDYITSLRAKATTEYRSDGVVQRARRLKVMRKILLALTFLTSACAPVLVPVPRRSHFYHPRPVVYLPAPPAVVIAPPAPHVRVW
jgi:hypothetical protein